MNFSLTRAAPQDARNWVSLLQDPDLVAFFGENFCQQSEATFADGFRLLGHVPATSSWFTARGDDGEFLGICGVSKRPENFDIFFAVVPAHRRKGLGAEFAREMKMHAELHGVRPLAVVDSANLVGQRTALAAGFKPLGATEKAVVFEA